MSRLRDSKDWFYIRDEHLGKIMEMREPTEVDVIEAERVATEYCKKYSEELDL